MATQLWPTTLPDCPSSWGEQDAEVLIRSETDDPATVKTRRRFTRTCLLVDCSLKLRKELYEEFKIFYRQTLRNGLDPFYYTHPYTGVQMVFEFRDTPKMSMVERAFEVSMSWREVVI